MPPDLSDELREEVVFLIKRIERPGLEQTRPCSLSFPKIVISEWRVSTLRHVFPRVAVNVLCHSRTATPVVPMVPQRSQKWVGPLFWAATSIQRDVAPTGDESYTRNPLPAFHSQLRCPKDVLQVMKVHSVNVSSPNLTLHTFPDTSTTAPMPCGTGHYSFQRSSCSSQTSVNDLIK